MKISFVLFCFLARCAWADDSIELSHETVTFTNLEGHVYQNVRLEHATLDGVIYSLPDTVGGGMVKFKDLSTNLLMAWKIPADRIGIAADREKINAEQKQQYDAAVYALSLKQQQEALDTSNTVSQADTPEPTPTTGTQKTPGVRGQKNRKVR